MTSGKKDKSVEAQTGEKTANNHKVLCLLTPEHCILGNCKCDHCNTANYPGKAMKIDDISEDWNLPGIVKIL